jgi:hypothetical protein
MDHGANHSRGKVDSAAWRGQSLADIQNRHCTL